MSEARFREIVAAEPYYGSWDEWAPIAYNEIPVLPRAVMSHVYGRHDDSPGLYAHCALCTYFRTELADEATP